VLASGVPYEFRTTVHPKLTTSRHITALTEELADMGCTSYALQDFRPVGCRTQDLLNLGSEAALDDVLVGQVKSRFPRFIMRKAE